MKMRRICFALVFTVSLLVVSAACRRQTVSQPTAAPVSVRLQTIEAKPHVAAEEVVGTVRPKLHAVIEAKITGRIEKMLVVSGQQVKAGELLAQLDTREVQAKLDQAIAVRQQTDNDLKRYETLRAKQVITPAEFEAVQSRSQVATAAATEAETMLGYATITAPFDGVVVRKLSDVGDLATPGKPLLELEDPRVSQFEAAVPEAVIDKVKLGARFPVHVLANEVEATVSEISPSAEPNSRTFVVKLDFPAGSKLRAGQFGRVAIPVSETDVLRVPATAVIQRGQMEIVFVVVNAHAQMRLVKTGRRFGSDVELLSGVTSGERVVIDNASSLADGEAVSPQS